MFGGNFAKPTLQSTKTISYVNSSIVSYHSIASLENTIKNFWELEEVTVMSPAEQACEEHYVSTHTRNAEGRYILCLLLKSEVATNNSYWLAYQRLQKVERFLSKHPDIDGQYREFVQDYEQSNHMEKVSTQDEQQLLVFIPHHHICRPSSTTTKLRVVFDGSSVMNTGQSFNDHLHKVQKLQRNIVNVIINFRFSRFVFSADIKQMFRQILVHPVDRKYQCILWSADPSDPIQ